MSEQSELKHSLSSLYSHLKHNKTRGYTGDASMKNTSGVRMNTDIPGFTRIGEYSYLREHAEPDPWLHAPADTVLATTGTPPSSLIFFDTETTGLSGGAGTIFFLIGLAQIRNKQLCIDQYFLSDFPGESGFLSILSEKLPDDAVYVSYNGKAFDSHLVYGRFLMHGKEKLLKHQYDLLFPCRRLWKDTIGSCTLKNIEAKVLGIPRENDIDGFEVPERYFSFLRTGNHKLLEPVFHHNYLDVLSLAKIHFLLESLIQAPESARAADPCAVARMVMKYDRGKAENFLSDRFERGDTKCGRELAFHYKQNKRFQDAHALFERLFASKKSIAAGIEMAKHLEHRTRNYHAAKETVETLLRSGLPLNADLRTQLLYRKDRLERKLDNSVSP